MTFGPSVRRSLSAAIVAAAFLAPISETAAQGRDGTAGQAGGRGAGTPNESGAAAPAQTVPSQRVIRYRYRPVVRVGQDYTLRADMEAWDLVVVLGSLTIDGRVNDDVYVWLGDVRVASTAVIEGSLIVVGGTATIEPGAEVRRDLAVFGGSLQAPVDFSPGSDHIVVGTPELGQGIRAVVPWIMRGLLWGRPIVPDLPWVWAIVGILFALSVGITLVFGQAVRASAEVVTARPLRAFLAGLVVLVVAAPILVILIATVVGVLVAPVFLFSLLVVWTVGKVGVARGIGRRVIAEGDPDSRAQALRSLTIGSALIVLLYMVPVLGIVAWSLISVFGLGCATTALLAAGRREAPARRKPGPSGTPPPVAPVAPVDPGAGSGPGAGGSGLDEFGGPESTPDEHEPPLRRPGAPEPGHGAAFMALPHASFLERTAAFALDCLLVAIVDRLLDSRQDGMFFILLIGYHIGFWAWQGTTIGGIIVGARVVREDGEPLRFVDAFIRGLAAVLSIAALGLGCFWMLRDPEHQTWHDKVAGTYVVKVVPGTSPGTSNTFSV